MTEATAASKLSMWLKSQSPARSVLPPQAVKAAVACTGCVSVRVGPAVSGDPQYVRDA